VTLSLKFGSVLKLTLMALVKSVGSLKLTKP